MPKVILEFDVDDKGSVKIKQFTGEAEKAFEKVGTSSDQASRTAQGSLEALKTHWVAASAAIVAGWVMVNKAMQFVELGAKAQQAEESFRLVAESSKIGVDALLANLTRAAAGTVDDSDIMQQAVKGMVLGLSDTQLVTIMENARIAARYAGVDVKTAYEAITTAIGTDMPRALRQYGLLARGEEQLLQEALADGATGISLYGLAMAHAAVNSAKFGDAQRNAAEAVQIFHNVIGETRETIGKATISTAQYLLAGAEGLNAFATRGVAGLMTLLGQEDAHARLMDASAEMMKTRNALLGIQTEEEKKAAEAAKVGAKAKLADAEAALKLEQEKIRSAAGAAKAAKEAAEETKRAAREELDQIEKLIKAREQMEDLTASMAKEDLAQVNELIKAREDAAKKWLEGTEKAVKAEVDAAEKVKKLWLEQIAFQRQARDLWADVEEASLSPQDRIAKRLGRMGNEFEGDIGQAMLMDPADRATALRGYLSDYASMAKELGTLLKPKDEGGGWPTFTLSWDKEGDALKKLAARVKEGYDGIARAVAESYQQQQNSAMDAWQAATNSLAGYRAEIERTSAAADTLSAKLNEAGSIAAYWALAASQIAGGGGAASVPQYDEQPMADAFVESVRGASSTWGTSGWGASSFESYDKGGVIPGPEGAPRIELVHGGEMVLNRGQQRALMSRPRGGSSGVSAGPVTIQLVVDGRVLGVAVAPTIEELAQIGQIRLRA